MKAVYGLDSLGGTKLVRPSNYMRSCNPRASSKTLNASEQMHSSLCCMATEGVLLSDLGSIRPPGWDSDAFASQLYWASIGLGLSLDEHASQIRTLFEEVCDGKGLKARQSQQSAFYSALQAYSMPDLEDTLTRKLSRFNQFS